MNAALFFERDLLDCGVPATEATAVTDRYARALERGFAADWIELYLATFASLSRYMHRTHAAFAPAAHRVLLLLQDDMGEALFDEDALDELRVRLADANRSRGETIVR